MEFLVDNGVALGDYDVTISNFNFLDGTNYTPVSDVTFTVHVVNAHTLVLDENSTTVPEICNGVNVRVLRTIKAGEWSTICLPFAMTEAQVKTSATAVWTKGELKTRLPDGTTLGKTNGKMRKRITYSIVFF